MTVMWKRAATLAASVLACACAAQPIQTDAEAELELAAKADVARGAGERVISDAAFSDYQSLSTDDIQGILDQLPNGWGRGPSFLAEERFDELSFAEVLHSHSVAYELNPVLMLTLLQVQESMVAQTERPSDDELASAFNCTCRADDCVADQEELQTFLGQLTCAGHKLREAFDAAGRLERTRANYEVGKAHPGNGRVPANRATAAVLTYMENSDLFFAVWRKLLAHAEARTGRDLGPWLEIPFNEGWIGGACDDAEDCTYAGATCAQTGTGRGVCTLPCSAGSACPDRGGNTVTFCVANDVAGLEGDADGYCIATCGLGDSCSEELSCTPGVARFGRERPVRDVCTADAPEIAEPEIETAGEEAAPPAERWEPEPPVIEIEITIEPPTIEDPVWSGTIEPNARYVINIHSFDVNAYDRYGRFWDYRTGDPDVPNDLLPDPWLDVWVGRWACVETQTSFCANREKIRRVRNRTHVTWDEPRRLFTDVFGHSSRGTELRGVSASRLQEGLIFIFKDKDTLSQRMLRCDTAPHDNQLLGDERPYVVECGDGYRVHYSLERIY
jgi:hypothetical protein